MKKLFTLIMMFVGLSIAQANVPAETTSVKSPTDVTQFVYHPNVNYNHTAIIQPKMMGGVWYCAVWYTRFDQFGNRWYYFLWAVC